MCFILGKETDFNYAENTAKVTNALQEEQVLYQGGTGKFAQQQHQQPLPQQHQQQQYQQQQQQHQHQYQHQQPNREQLRTQSSYTKPKNEPLQQIPDLKPEMSLWQTTSASTGSQARSKLAQAHYQHVEQRQTPPPVVATHVPPPAGRKMMSLEEIEAQIKNQAKSRPQPVSMPSGGHSPVPPFANQHQPYPNQVPQFSQHHMHQMQQQHQKQLQQQNQQNQPYNPNLNPNYHAQQQLRQDVPSANYGKPPIAFDSKPQQQPPQLSQSFGQQQNVQMVPNPQVFNPQAGPNQRQPQFPGNVPFPINNLGPLPNNLAMKPPTELTEEERVALMQEEQKRMRRNAKIAQLVSLKVRDDYSLNSANFSRRDITA